MAISSAAEVYTVLQRHLDTLLIIFIMCLKRQRVSSGWSTLGTEWEIWFWASDWPREESALPGGDPPQAIRGPGAGKSSQSHRALKRCAGLHQVFAVCVLWLVSMVGWLQSSWGIGSECSAEQRSRNPQDVPEESVWVMDPPLPAFLLSSLSAAAGTVCLEGESDYHCSAPFPLQDLTLPAWAFWVWATPTILALSSSAPPRPPALATLVFFSFLLSCEPCFFLPGVHHPQNRTSSLPVGLLSRPHPLVESSTSLPSLLLPSPHSPQVCSALTAISESHPCIWCPYSHTFSWSFHLEIISLMPLSVNFYHSQLNIVTTYVCALISLPVWVGLGLVHLWILQAPTVPTYIAGA